MHLSADLPGHKVGQGGDGVRLVDTVPLPRILREEPAGHPSPSARAALPGDVAQRLHGVVLVQQVPLAVHPHRLAPVHVDRDREAGRGRLTL